MKCTLVALLLLTLCSSATPASPSFSCDGAIQNRCNFVCDCWDCSDERDCGYHRDSREWGVPFSCDFEEDDCGWRDISTTSYRWLRDRRNSPLWSSRPHGDHTLGNRWGWFMVAEGRSGKSAVSARLQSPLLRDAAATCEIHIHYLLWSSNSTQINGGLSVQLVDSTQGMNVWQSPQTSQKSWRRAVIYTGRISGEFQVIVTASHGAFSWADIAVDDIEFRHCAIPEVQAQCQAGQQLCVRGSCVEESAVCDGTDDCGDGSDERSCATFHSCSFEGDTCGWTSTWERVTGSSSKPGRDHSTNKKSGFFLRASNTTKSVLTSPQLLADQSCFLVFYYLLDGSSDNSLTVKGGTIESQWKGQRGPVWIREKVTFQPSNNTFQITIEGAAGGALGTVALDDVILSPGCKVQGISSRLHDSLDTQKMAEISTRQACAEPTMFDFEKDEAGWTDVSIGHLKWGKSPGSYLAVLNAEGNLRTHAEIHSSLLCAVKPLCAMNVTYYLNGGPEGFLNLRVWDPQSGTHTHAWHSQGERSESWTTVQIPLGERQQPFQLVLSGSVDPQPERNWSAVVNKIQFSGCNDTLTEPVTCNFENGLCGWYQDLTDEIDWKMGHLSDHTTGQGSYMYVEGESRKDRGDRARLICASQAAPSAKCLSFHVRMLGPDTGTLNLLIKYDGEEEKLIWTRSGTHGNRWHRDSVTLTNKKYQLIFEAVRDGSVGHIAIDDITVTSGACPAPTHCSFEVGACDFSSGGTYVWKLHNNSRVESHTGPYIDHTLHSITGHYMVVDTSSTYLHKNTATLTSSKYNELLVDSCLSFWYHLGGTNPGTLTVYIEKDTGKKKVKTQLVSISGTPQDGWHHKSVALQSESSWVLLFEAVGAGGDQSYIAVDDIHISHHKCHDAVTCDFEHGSCYWTNLRIPMMDAYDWDWTYGAALNKPSSAPGKDHSLGTPKGHYAFVDTGAMHTEGATAWLTSEHLPATAGSCFSFWYRTDSPDHFHLGELVLYISSAKGLLPVWVLRGIHHDDWQEVQLQLNSTVEFQITFEASKGSRPHSAIVSLDNLKYTPDTLCNVEPKPPGPGPAKKNSGTIWAIVVSVIIILFLLLLVFLVYRRWRRNRNNDPGLPDQSDQIDGFDNVTYDQFQNEDGISNTSDR